MFVLNESIYSVLIVASHFVVTKVDVHEIYITWLLISYISCLLEGENKLKKTGCKEFLWNILFILLFESIVKE